MKKGLLLVIAVALTACSEYQNALKSQDTVQKYTVAKSKYEEGKYAKALRLFEQIGPSYKGKPQAEKLFWMYADSYYQTKQYYLSGYQFEQFSNSYPRSEKAEDAAFLAAVSYAKVAPVHSIDQEGTDKALDKFQVFVERFPNSEKLSEANRYIAELQNKLERKAYEIAYNYYKVEDYRSAIVALDNFIQDYPGTPFREKALYYRLESAYILASNSVTSKQQERFMTAKAAYSNLVKAFPNSEYRAKADQRLAEIEKGLQQFSK